MLGEVGVSKIERRYFEFYDGPPIEPTALGSRQFFDRDTHGIEPADPDPYYLALMRGKKWFGVCQEQGKP